MARQLTLSFEALPHYAQEDFFVSNANRTAYDWVMAWPHWDSYALLLTGPEGSGKTHLAAVWCAHAKAIQLPPQRLGQVPSDILMGNARAACIDAIDAVENEEGLFHLLNFAKEQQRSLLLVAPAQMELLTTPDLRSRLNALPHATLTVPDDALLAAVLGKQFADRQLTVAPAILDFLAARMERSFVACARMVDALDQAALAEGRAITLPLARHVLETM